MPSNIEFNQFLTESLVEAITGESKDSSVYSADPQVTQHLIDLVDGIPYLKDPNWEDCYRGAVVNLMETSLPQEPIICPKSYYQDTGKLGMYSYPNENEYQDYKAAFFHGISRSELANHVKDYAAQADPTKNDAFWRDYCVAILTDAIRSEVSVEIDQSSLDDSLDRFHDELKPALSATSQAVYDQGYSPTAGPLDIIKNAGESEEAANLLDHSIQNGLFTANLNLVMASPPDGPPAATWFLFNLWETLKALGYPDVDGAIERYESPEVGLLIPSEVGPVNWWNGTYSSWHRPFASSDIPTQAYDSIAHTLDIEMVFFDAFHRPIPPQPSDWPNGYAISFAEYGDRSYYYSGAPNRSNHGKSFAQKKPLGN